ncbi:hypothetical protein G6F40_016223 [Rhizopus arrhizus]|nr:hypothetical protein G6F40_016223 [Rhizopus arrhizus]
MVPATDRHFISHGAEVQAHVIELDDARHQSVDEDRHCQCDHRQRQQLVGEGRGGHHAQGQHDDLGREDEVGADRALHLVLLPRHHVHLCVGQRLAPLGLALGVVIG